MKRVTILTLLFFCLFSLSVYAHSGGTDGQGGHHDYNNVSGLGEYHFHEGHEAHLHVDGICPFEENVNTQSPNTSTSSSESEYSGYTSDYAPVVEEHEWWAFWELQTGWQFLTGAILISSVGYFIVRLSRGNSK